MAITATLPTVSADSTDTILGSKCIFSFTPEGGSNIDILAKLGSITPTIEKLERKAPDANGLLVTDRTVVTGKKWTIRLTFDEFNAGWLSFLNTVYQPGEGRLWILDPDDSATTAALMSNNFTCTCSPDGEMSFAQDQFAEGAIIVDINGTFTLEADATIT